MFSLIQVSVQNPVEWFVLEQAETAVMGRQVDFENLANVLREKKDSIDHFVYDLASVEIAKAMNRPGEVLTLIDRILSYAGAWNFPGIWHIF